MKGTTGGGTRASITQGEGNNKACRRKEAHPAYRGGTGGRVCFVFEGVHVCVGHGAWQGVERLARELARMRLHFRARFCSGLWGAGGRWGLALGAAASCVRRLTRSSAVLLARLHHAPLAPHLIVGAGGARRHGRPAPALLLRCMCIRAGSGGSGARDASQEVHPTERPGASPLNPSLQACKRSAHHTQPPAPSRRPGAPWRAAP